MESSIVFGSRGNISPFQGAQRLLYTDVSSARVARVGPPSAAQDEVGQKTITFQLYSV